MPKQKKKATSSPSSKITRGRTRGRKLLLDDVPQGEEGKIILYPDEKPDIEDVEVLPDDDAAKHKYPPPRKHPRFREIWMQFIDSISGRDNFKAGHLRTFEILCDLYVEYDELRAFIRKRGRSYKSIGRQGVQWKYYPEVEQLNKVQAQIKSYMIMLGLTLKKDTDTDDPSSVKGEWD